MKRAAAVAALAALVFLPAAAAELAGVALPDPLEKGGAKLVLNGLGLREATILKVDVYVAGLYLEKKTSKAADVLGADEVRFIDLRFVRHVGKADLVKAWNEGFSNNSPGTAGKLVGKLSQLTGAMTDIAKGESMTFLYVPGKGTTVAIRGKDVTTIEGPDFARAMFACWLGPKPPNAELKEGLLGLGGK